MFHYYIRIFLWLTTRVWHKMKLTVFFLYFSTANTKMYLLQLIKLADQCGLKCVSDMSKLIAFLLLIKPLVNICFLLKLHFGDHWTSMHLKKIRRFRAHPPVMSYLIWSYEVPTTAWYTYTKNCQTIVIYIIILTLGIGFIIQISRDAMTEEMWGMSI